MPLDTSSDLQERNRCIEHVVSLLVACKYQELEWLSRGTRLDASTLKRAVSEYGRTLVISPAANPAADWVKIEDSCPPKWSVHVPLFTAEEGRSDLTLILTLRQDAAGRYQVEIDGLRVL